MGRPRRLDSEGLAEVARLRSRGLGDAAIAAQLGCSLSTVARVPRVGATRRVSAPRSAAPLPGAPLPDPPYEPGEAMGVDEQRRVLSDLLRDKARDARGLAETSPAEANTAARLATALAGALRHLTDPTPMVDPNERLDMTDAARAGRAKLDAYVEKIRLGK